ncbi:MAG: LacI family DNA-binding transcriptional regulator [Rhizobiales bacterium]|nr:LacI family DNA-binding transcriptional regulator [Hyphomicrobiales bacterium]
MNKSAATSADVADLAGVSQSAVSRAFSPGASISAKTREKVLKAADALGYRPNALARAMISGRSRLVAVLVAYLDNQFYPLALEQLSRALQARGYQTLIFMTETGNQDVVVQKMLQYQVEGIIMLSAELSSSLASECAATGTPVLLFNRYVPGLPASSVTSDNLEGGRQVAHHLADSGHTRIAFIAGQENSSTSRDREAGFCKGLAERGMTPVARAVGGYTFDGAARAARELFAKPDRPDSVFVANDHMAFAVMDVLRNELRLRIPQDVSVVGYDDVPEASWGGYDLTSVSQNLGEMIQATIDILMSQIDRQHVKRKAAIIPARLVARGSARMPGGST